MASAVVGIFAVAALGGLIYMIGAQRDRAQVTLARAQQQLAVRRATDAYLTLYISHGGKVTTAYENLTACDSYIVCRAAAADELVYMNAFQSARSSAAVPSALATADREIGNALAASIAADEELIIGMDSGDKVKVADGFKKLDAGMLSFAQAESALAASLG